MVHPRPSSALLFKSSFKYSTNTNYVNVTARSSAGYYKKHYNKRTSKGEKGNLSSLSKINMSFSVCALKTKY